MSPTCHTFSSLSLPFSPLLVYKSANKRWDSSFIHSKTKETMLSITQYFLLVIYCSCLIQARFFHRPLILDDEFMAMLETNAYDESNNPSIYNPAISDQYVFISKDYDDGNRAIKKKIHSNLNLPRYLRDLYRWSFNEHRNFKRQYDEWSFFFRRIFVKALYRINHRN